MTLQCADFESGSVDCLHVLKAQIRLSGQLFSDRVELSIVFFEKNNETHSHSIKSAWSITFFAAKLSMISVSECVSS